MSCNGCMAGEIQEVCLWLLGLQITIAIIRWLGNMYATQNRAGKRNWQLH